MGRAQLPREKRGYKADLEHLERLRKAVLSDERLPTLTCIEVVKAVRVIKRLLRPYEQGEREP